MLRTLSIRGLRVCQGLKPLYSLDSASTLDSIQLKSCLRFHHLSRFSPLGATSTSTTTSSSFPNASSNISSRFFHGQSILSSSNESSLYLNDDQYIDLDEPLDVIPDRYASRKAVSGYSDYKAKREDINEEEDDHPPALTRSNPIDEEERQPGLPAALTSLLTSYRDQATAHNEELEISRSEHASDVPFEQFGLEPKLIARLKQLKYGSPFEIQAKTMTALLDGKNVVGQAVTGSGKTLAFAIPLVNALMKTRDSWMTSTTQPKALILTPTRELCNQITDAVSQLDPTLKTQSLYGGRSINADFANLRLGVDVVCATPGRLRDHIKRKSISLDSLQFLVLDEADEMLKDAWIEDLEDILEGSPEEKQVILFSATMPPEIYEVAENFLKRELEVIRVKDIESDDNAPSAVNHLSLFVPPRDQTETVKGIIDFYKPKSTIVFVPTRNGTMQVSEGLRRMGIRGTQVLQGGMSQSHRDGVIQGFRNGRFSVMVATDVAARGLDIPNVELIVQMGLPNGLAAYLHRSGRTGRAGKAGLALLVHAASKQECDFVRDLKRKVKNLKELDLADRRDAQNRQSMSNNPRGGYGGNLSGYGSSYGGFQRRVNDYGDFQRGRDNRGGGFRSRGGDFQQSRGGYGSDDFGGGGGGGGRGGYGRGGGGRDRGEYNDRRPNRRDDHSDDFGNESRRPPARADFSSESSTWMENDGIQSNFKSFMEKRQSGGGRGPDRRSKRDDDDDIW